MPRPVKGWWDESRQVWYARLGKLSEKTGKPGVVILRGPDGQPITKDDEKGRDEAIAEILGSKSSKRGPTMAEVARAYVAWHVAEGSAPRTIRGHWYHLNRFAAFEHQGVAYGVRPAAEIVPQDLWRFKQTGKGQLRQMYMSLLACWKWAARPVEGREPEIMIPVNTLAGVIRPRKGPPQGVTEWGLARQVLRLARGWARQRPKTRGVRTRAGRWVKVQALAAIAYGGPRTAEAVTLEWGDIRWESGVAEIPIDRHKTGSKTGKIRRFPLMPRTIRILRILERWPHRHPRYVFATRWQSEPRIKDWWDWIRLDLKPWLSKHGVELPPRWRPYWLRHSFATAALDAGVDIEAVASAMGNSPEVLRAVYDHVSPKRVASVGEAVAKARRKKAE